MGLKFVPTLDPRVVVDERLLSEEREVRKGDYRYIQVGWVDLSNQDYWYS